ncbi:hypothetical protein ACFVU2_17150 [Leifsonia sp. NPDC058194]|uniref:hypothetical protein n=1 Tax=Leifsonia sp. NPDC058194 TaxID=3346374 RepID=UPI0036D84228
MARPRPGRTGWSVVGGAVVLAVLVGVSSYADGGQAPAEVAETDASSFVLSAAPEGACDPNYAGACVPIASDVDCAGGNGNGPAYVEGPVQVVGTDIYDLDRDGDGVGCE